MKEYFCAHSAGVGLMEKSLNFFNVAKNYGITIFNQPDILKREKILR